MSANGDLYYADWNGALRHFPKLARCAHPHCRTTLTEDDVTYCPHEVSFCEGCTWEEGGCDECDALGGDAA